MNNPSIDRNNRNSLKQYIDAVVDQRPGAAQTDNAQRKLAARLEQVQADAGGAPAARRLGWAATAAAAVLLPMLLWMPAPNSALAFADVQRYFSGFETLTAQLTTRAGGNEIMTMTIRVDGRDRARLDAGSSFSYVIDPHQALMLQLFHEQARALLVPLAQSDPFEETAGLDWLADIRAFQGQAGLLEETVMIRGQEASGFNLKVDGMDITLWAAESGKPLSLRMAGPGGVETQIDFDFDRPLDETLFSLNVPAGYRLLGAAESDDLLE